MARRVLVIDDDEPVRRLLADFMSSFGYEVEAASDGVEGLTLFAQGRHDLVVTDVRMPGVNGWDVVRGVRRIRPDVAIVVVSGIETEITHAGDDITGLDRLVFLPKPVSLEELRRAIDEVLGSR